MSHDAGYRRRSIVLLIALSWFGNGHANVDAGVAAATSRAAAAGAAFVVNGNLRSMTGRLDGRHEAICKAWRRTCGLSQRQNCSRQSQHIHQRRHARIHRMGAVSDGQSRDQYRDSGVSARGAPTLSGSRLHPQQQHRPHELPVEARDGMSRASFVKAAAGSAAVMLALSLVS